MGGNNEDWTNKDRSRFGGIFSKYKIERTGGSWSKKYQETSNIKHWDIAPDEEYFKELFRVSKNQIIWGGNYFGLPPNRCFLIWKKLTISESFTMAMAEYAWCSFNDNSKIIECAPQGTKNEIRFHPTQKPIYLYKKTLEFFAKAGDKIIDTHVGSGSSLIAGYDMGFDMVGSETDPDYYKQSKARLDYFMKQPKIEDIILPQLEQLGF